MTEQIIDIIKDEKKENKQNKNQIQILSKPKK